MTEDGPQGGSWNMNGAGGVVQGLVMDGYAANFLRDDLANRYMAEVAHDRASLLEPPPRKRSRTS